MINPKVGQEVWGIRYGELGAANPEFYEGRISVVHTVEKVEGAFCIYFIDMKCRDGCYKPTNRQFRSDELFLSKKDAVDTYKSFLKESIDQLEEELCDE